MRVQNEVGFKCSSYMIRKNTKSIDVTVEKRTHEQITFSIETPDGSQQIIMEAHETERYIPIDVKKDIFEIHLLDE